MWTPVDFLDLGPRAAVDKALQRLAAQETVTRIDRGLYYTLTVTGMNTAYGRVIAAQVGGAIRVCP
jgi:hypothetical protein